MTIDNVGNNIAGPVKAPNAGGAAANGAPGANKPVEATPAGPALGQDANQVNVPEGDVLAVDIDGIELDESETNALKSLKDVFMADGVLSAAEAKAFQDVRVAFGAKATVEQPVADEAVAPTGGTKPTAHNSPDHTPSPITSKTSGEVESPDQTGPNPKSWSHGSNVVEGRKFSSVGDPHETTGDGGKFDNMEEGNFVKARSASGDFELQTVQGKDVSGRWPNATVNHAAAVKSGNDVVAYNGIDKTLTINGEAKELKPGQSYELPGGGKVDVTDKGVNITTQAGDVVDITQRDNYIDVRGEVDKKENNKKQQHKYLPRKKN